MIARYRDGRIAPSAARRRARRSYRRRSRVASQSGSTASTSPPRSTGSGWSCAGSTARRGDAPWQLAKDDARADELDAVLYDLADGLRVVAIALASYLPERPRGARGARPAAGRSTGSRWRMDAPGRQGIEAAPPALPAASTSRPPRRVTDAHAHLDACDEPAGGARRAGRSVGVTRVVTIGTGIDSCRRALAIADENNGVVAALGIDPHRAATAEARTGRGAARAPRASACGRGGGDGPRLPPWTEHAREQRVLFDAQLALAEELDLPVVIHSRAASRETADALAPFHGTVVLHCFSEPDLLEAALERDYYVSFAGNVTYPKAAALRESAALVAEDRLLAETDSPYLAPQPVRGRPNEPMHVRHTLSTLADVRGVGVDALEACIDENAARAFGLNP